MSRGRRWLSPTPLTMPSRCAMSGTAVLARRARAFAPSSASTTSKPALFNVKETMSRMVLESSTVRIRLRMSYPPLPERLRKPQIVECRFKGRRRIHQNDCAAFGFRRLRCSQQELDAGCRHMAYLGTVELQNWIQRQGSNEPLLPIRGVSQVQRCRQEERFHSQPWGEHHCFAPRNFHAAT